MAMSWKNHARWAWVAFVSLFLLGTACRAIADEVFTFAVVPQFEQRKLFAIWKPVVDELSQRTGLHLRLVATLTVPNSSRNSRRGHSISSMPILTTSCARAHARDTFRWCATKFRCRVSWSLPRAVRFATSRNLTEKRWQFRRQMRWGFVADARRSREYFPCQNDVCLTSRRTAQFI